MFNGFLPRYIAEKGIDTGNNTIQDTYRQCFPQMSLLSFRCVDLVSGNSGCFCRVLYSRLEISWSKRRYGDLSGRFRCLSCSVRETRIREWSTRCKLYPSISSKYLLCRVICLQVDPHKLYLTTVRKYFPLMYVAQALELQACWREFVRSYTRPNSLITFSGCLW
jgi:hypothetical protein